MADPTFTPFVPVWLDSPAAADVFDPTALPGLIPGAPLPVGDQLAAGGGAPIPFTAPPPAPGPADAPPSMQPGLGIPAPVFDAAAAQLYPPAAQPTPPAVVTSTPPPAPSFDSPIGRTTTLDPFAREAPAESGAPRDPYDTGTNPLTDPNLSAEDAAARLGELNQTNPQLAAQYAAQWQQDREDDLAQEALLQAHADARRARESLELQERAVNEANRRAAMIEADATALAQQKIDPTRFASNRSTGQKLFDLIGAIAGGAFAGAAGRGDGRNLYIEDWEKQVDRDIDAQKADLANAWQGIGARRGIVADAYARSGDLYHAAETARLALKMSARDALLAQQQLFDPRGSRAMRIAQSVAQVNASIAANQRALVEKNLELQLKLSEEARKQREADDKHAAAAAKLAGGGVGGGGSGKILMSPAAFASKNNIKVWGEAERRMYAEYVAREQVRVGRVAPAAAPGASAAGTPSAVAPPPRGVPRAPKDAPPVASTATGTARRYQTKDDWFSEHRPTTPIEDRKRYWFVDGNNGNDVPPVEIEAGVDPEKFLDRQTKRRNLAEKVDQLRLLTERLQKRGFWSKAVGSRISWKNDADVQEARALAEDVTGDVIQEKGMGVPSGNDVERVKTMAGGDPAGWQDPTPNLQRYRQSLQIAQDADWETAAGAAAKDPRYDQYRVLPTASPAWVQQLQRRGEVKEIGPEYGNTDPKQLDAKPLTSDAPNTAGAKANAQLTRRREMAAQYLEASGAVAPAEGDLAAAELGAGTSSRARPTPQVSDFPYRGAPEAADAFAKLRAHHVNNTALLNRFIASGDDKDWKAFQTGERLMIDALGKVLTETGQFYQLVPPSKRMTWVDDPELVAHLAGVVLRSGGR